MSLLISFETVRVAFNYVILSKNVEGKEKGLVKLPCTYTVDADSVVRHGSNKNT